MSFNSDSDINYQFHFPTAILEILKKKIKELTDYSYCLLA